MSRRYISDRGAALALIEVTDDGDSDIVGPVTTHAELDQLARQLLSGVSSRDRLPDPVHKLALGYLALLGIDEVVPTTDGKELPKISANSEAHVSTRADAPVGIRSAHQDELEDVT